MAVMDEFKEERAALKNASPKEKLSYFWYYYKVHVIVIACVIAMAGSFIYQIATKKETAFNAVMLNASTMFPLESRDPYEIKFAEYAQIDLNEYDVMFDTSIRIDEKLQDENAYTSVQKLAVYTAAGDLDVMVTDTDSFRRYANSYVFYDLRDLLTEDLYEKYEPYFYYVDQKVVDEIDAANSALDDTYVPVYPDPTKPEEMETPIPVGILLPHTDTLTEHYYFRSEDGAAEQIAVGVYINTKHVDTALKYIEFAFAD